MSLDDIFWEQLKQIYFDEDKNFDKFNKEKPILIEVLNQIVDKLENEYEFDKPIGRGGAGIVIRLKDKSLDIFRALKIPRPIKENIIKALINEREHLTKIRHKNIIAIYSLGDVTIDFSELSPSKEYPFFIMEYMEDPKDLKEKIKNSLVNAETSNDLHKLTTFIASTFYKIIRAINFLHDNEIIHFDIKPSNILIDKQDNPTLSDLGFAKKKNYDTKETEVGFTLFYAHPELKRSYRLSSSKNRVKNRIAPNDFKYNYDIYAMGKTLLEILSLVDYHFPDIVVYDYYFIYMHLLACRMLDGRNLNETSIRNILVEQERAGEIPSVYKEEWLELEAKDFESIKYSNIGEIVKDFEKLLKREKIFDSIPELNFYYHKRVQISVGIPAPFSLRVKKIIEHPVFSRLVDVPQLGLTNTVYPTATHNRLEHSLGVFRYCSLYIQSLYNDPFNPLFKQLINEEDIKTLLLASLLHDLGHYPLAHEIEEFYKDYNHVEYTKKLLNSQVRNNSGYTIRDLIENTDEWNLDVNYLDEVIKPDKRQDNLKIQMLHSIIDGPVDVDKLDYLQRDSQNCGLKYGELIDVDRLIRNLTVIITKMNKEKRTKKKLLVIGIYEKGQTAAESLAFARYLLYQSLYWHHTLRSIRTMLRVAIKPMIMFEEKIIKEKKQKLKTKEKQQSLIEFQASLKEEIDFMLGVKTEPVKKGIYHILDIIEAKTNESGKNLIRMIRNRDYYKRILTIHEYFKKENEVESLLDKFRKHFLSDDFQKDLQRKIKDKFDDYCDSLTKKVSLLSPENINITSNILNEPKMILCDCPKIKTGINHSLKLIPEPQRIQKNYFKRVEIGERVSEVYSNVYVDLMKIVAKGRIFCHPDIRGTLMAALGPDLIKQCLTEVLEDCE